MLYYAPMEPIVLDCQALEWLQLLKKHAAKGEEVDLVHFKHAFDMELCERIAGQHNLRFTVDQEHDTAFFRKQKPPKPQA